MLNGVVKDPPRFPRGTWKNVAARARERQNDECVAAMINMYIYI